MEEEPPQPEEPGARDHTTAQQKRVRSDSGSSSSAESIQSTRTLQSEDFEFIHENGRIYGNTSYFMPCDEAEQDRLTIEHQVYVLALKGRLTTTKVTGSTRRILDLGTGPGDWAVAMARQHLHAEVTGIDMTVWDLETTEGDSGASRVLWEIDDLDVWGTELDNLQDITSRLKGYDPFRDPAIRHPDSPLRTRAKNTPSATQPSSPYSAETTIDPFNLEPVAVPGWHFSHPYDLIHLRSMRGAFAQWEDVYGEIYKNLAPGGHIEVVDYELVLPEMLHSTSEPGATTSLASARSRPAEEFAFPSIRKLYRSVMEASFKSGKPLGTFYLNHTFLEDVGFKDLRTTYVNVPVGTWPVDEEQKRIGKMFLVVLMESLEPVSLRLLTKCGDAERLWTLEDVKETVEKGKREVLEWGESVEGQIAGGQEMGKREGWCANFKWVVGRKSKSAKN